MVIYCCLMGLYSDFYWIMNGKIYPLVMTNLVMENPQNKWRFITGKIIYQWAMASMAMLNNQRVPSGNLLHSY